MYWKCSMLFCKIEFLFSLLQHCFEKNAILLSKGPFKPCKTFVNKVAHSLKHVFYSIWTCRFLLAKCAAFLSESVARAYCRFHWWCKSLFKKDVFFSVLKQVQHQLLQYFLSKSTAVLLQSCFVLNRVLCDLQKVFRMCNIFVHEVEYGLKQCKTNFLL